MKGKIIIIIGAIFVLAGLLAFNGIFQQSADAVNKGRDIGPLMDNFNDSHLGKYWIIGPGEDQRNDQFWSLEENKGYLTIITQKSDVHTSSNNPKNFFLRNAPDQNYTFTTKMSFSPGQSFEQAGLIVWNGPDDYIRFTSIFTGMNEFEAAIESHGKFSSQQRVNPIGNDVYLKIRKIGRTFTYLVSGDGKEWKKIGFSVKASYEDEKIGLFAISPGSGRHIPAKFDFFKIKKNPKVDDGNDETDYKLPKDTVPVDPGGNQKIVPYINPVFNHDAPDPAAIKAENGYYYVISTQSVYNGELKALPILRSKDLVHWDRVGEVFPNHLPGWVDQEDVNIWAPDLVYHDGKYYVYYSAAMKKNEDGGGQNFGIGVAVSETPVGPYEDKGPLVTGTSFKTIDPMIFTDQDGSRYMYWGSGFEPIKVQKLSGDGLSLVGEPKKLLYPHYGNVVIKDTEDRPYVENYQRLIEGPWVVKRGDYYYMFYSGDNCCGPSAHYAVMVARSTSPMGPFVKFNGGEPILKANGHFIAPGHNAMIQDAAGQDWMLYHAFHPEDPRGRALMLDRVLWKDGWPVINGPSYTKQENGPIINR